MMTPDPAKPSFSQSLGVLARDPLNFLLPAIVVAAALEPTDVSDLWVFIASAVAIVPLAGLMGRSTESLAATLGPSLGGLLNATFGNAAEMIIAMMALTRGPEMYPLVKASITGSIIGNILLVLGAAMLVGGVRRDRQHFNRNASSSAATLLMLACVGLTIPTLHYYLYRSGRPPAAAAMHEIELLSEEIAAILALVYFLSLLFSLVTHRDCFRPANSQDPAVAAPREEHQPELTNAAALFALLMSTLGVTWMSHLLVGSVEPAADSIGMNHIFVGVIVVAIIGNAAEHSTAIVAAWKNDMDLAVSIATGSSTQVALLIVPVLVMFSAVLGLSPTLDLHFTPLEIVSLLLSVIVLPLVCLDGESNWMEGVMLLAVYAIIALAFFHLPETAMP
jgi:Ca2+:H+ antiporter